jgi:hypothetical protein
MVHYHRDFNLPACQADDLWFTHGFRFNTGHFIVDSRHYEWIDGFNFAFRKGGRDVLELFSFLGARIVLYIEIPLAWYVPGWRVGFPFFAVPPSVLPRQVSENEQFEMEYLHYYGYYYYFFIIFVVRVSFVSITLTRSGYQVINHHEADRFRFGTKDAESGAEFTTQGERENEVRHRLAANVDALKETNEGKQYQLSVQHDEAGNPTDVRIQFKPGSKPSSDLGMWDDLWSQLRDAIGFQGSPTEEEIMQHLGDLGLQMIAVDELLSSQVDRMLLSAFHESIAFPVEVPT